MEGTDASFPKTVSATSELSRAEEELQSLQQYAEQYFWTIVQAEMFPQEQGGADIVFICDNKYFTFGVLGEVSSKNDTIKYSYIYLESRKTLTPIWESVDVKNDTIKDMKNFLRIYAKKNGRVYQNPKSCFQIQDEIKVRKTTYKLKTGMSGYKVYLVKKKLGDRSNAGSAKYAKYTITTKKCVKKFQKKKGLKQTGVVNLKTWLTMGFSKKSWYYADSYVYPVQITRFSARKNCIDAMIKAAKSYLGTHYVWCAAAKPKQGIDCAGLVIQSLYAVGIDPLPSGSHVYAFPKNEYTTKIFWKNHKFKHVQFKEKKRGDILYYQGHVAIYLGNGKMIEARSSKGKVVISPVRGNVIGVMRVFN